MVQRRRDPHRGGVGGHPRRGGRGGADDSQQLEPNDLNALAAGRILTAQATIDRWFEYAAHAQDPARPPRSSCAQAVADAGATILDEAARASGSRPFATGTALDRARRDFELFVLQHRLDPLVARLGRDAIERMRPRVQPAFFDDLYAHDRDPWNFETSAYEAAKYDATIARSGGPPLRHGPRDRLLDRRAHRAAGRPRATTCWRSTSPPRALAIARATRNPGVTLRAARDPRGVPRRRLRPDGRLRGPLLPRRRRPSSARRVERTPRGTLLAVHWRPRDRSATR